MPTLNGHRPRSPEMTFEEYIPLALKTEKTELFFLEGKK